MLSFSIVLTTLAAFTAASPLAARTDSCMAAANDKAETFDATGGYAMQANQAPVPSGYTRVGSAPATAAASSASYITYKTLGDFYDTTTCSKFCDSTLGCNTFNVYVERDPQVTPTTSCQNPASKAVYQCALYRAVLGTSSLTNNGQYRQQFHVVIAGSYLYTKNAPPAVTRYNGPYSYDNKAIEDPAHYLTYETFPNQQTYDPKVCADRCDAISQANSKAGQPTCKFFDAYIAYQTNKAPVFTCAYYSQNEEDPRNPGAKATNSGYTNNGITYSFGNSNGYALN